MYWGLLKQNRSRNWINIRGNKFTPKKSWPFYRVNPRGMEIGNPWPSVTRTKNGLPKILWRRAICSVYRWNETTGTELQSPAPGKEDTDRWGPAPGVLVSSKASRSQPWRAAKVPRAPGCMYRNRASRWREVKWSSPSTQHLLDHTASSFGTPEKDIREPKRVQRGTTKVVMGLKHLPYEKRLRDLALFSPQKRELQGT